MDRKKIFLGVIAVGLIIYLIIAKVKGLPPFKKSSPPPPELPPAIKGLINTDGKSTMPDNSYLRVGGKLIDGNLTMWQGSTGNLCIKNTTQNVNKWCSNYVPPDKTHTDFALVFKDGILSTYDLQTGQSVFTIAGSSIKGVDVNLRVGLSEKGPTISSQ